MSRRLRVALGIAAGLVVLLAIAWTVLVPWYARKRLIEEAAGRGVTLSIGDLTVSFGEIVVSNATANALEVPGVTLSIGRAEIHLRNFAPETIAVTNASFDVDGSAGVVTRALERFLASQPKGTGPKGPNSISLQNTRIEWRRALGDGTVLHVGDLGGDVKGDPLGTDAQAHFAAITIDIGAVSLGPWSGTLAKDQTRSQIDVVLSPKGFEVGSLTVAHVVGTEGFSAGIHVPKPVALTELGLTKTILSLFSLEDTSIAIDATHAEDSQRGSGTIRKLRVEGARLARAPSPVALEVTNLAYAGPLEKMSVTSGRVSVGPLSGPLEGTLGRPPGAAMADLRTTTDVMSCADAVRQQTSAFVPQNVAQGLDTLSRAFGVQDAVKGTVTAHVEWHTDTRQLGGAKFTVAPTASCELSFFPH